MKNEVDLRVVPAEKIYEDAAKLFVSAANEAAQWRGVFRVALSGGSTPKGLYSLLAEDYADRVPWDKVHIYFGDERCVPPDDPESNFKMVHDAMLARINIPEANIHRMKGEIDPEEAAADYERDLIESFGLQPGELPIFDLILLGIGPDGHTASLFPESHAICETKRLVVATYVEKLDSTRLTLTPPVLKSARKVLFLIAGSEKAAALKHVLESDYQPGHYPAQLLRKAEGEVVWLVDKLAMGSQVAAVDALKGAADWEGDLRKMREDRYPGNW